MNFQQLRSVREAVRQDFNLTAVANVLNTSQPGVSRQIRELEDELGVEIFVRAGKRLTGLTAPGLTIVPIVERLLLDAENLKRAGDDYSRQDRGTLAIAATHSQARYALPTAVRDFRATHDDVLLHMHQGTPQQVAQMPPYVELGLGVGIVAAIAFDEERDAHLTALDARHLFATNMTRLAVRRGAYLRGYVYDFIETFAPTLTRELVERALASAPGVSFDI